MRLTLIPSDTHRGFVCRQASTGEVLQATMEQVLVISNRVIGYRLLRYLGGEEMKYQLRKQPQAEIFFNYFGQQRDSAEPKARG